MKSLLQPSLAFSLLLAASTSMAVTEPHHHREHGAHEHGVAALKIALSEHEFDVEFESPAINLVGFEHAVSSDKDRQAVAQAAQLLRQPLTLLNLPAAAHCAVIKTTVESELLGNATDAPAHEHSGEHEHEHADFNAKHQLQCKDPNALDVVGVQLFDMFKGIEKINAQWLTATSQNAKVLTPTDHTIRLQ